MFEPRNMENDIDKLPTAPEHPRIAPSDPHDIIAMVQQHIALMAGQMIEPIVVLEQLTRICLQLRYVGQRNYKLVIHEYSQAVQVYPDNAYIHFSLGTIHQQLGNFDKAVNAYNLALCESSLEVIARYNAARCLLYQGQPDDAIQQLSQALRKVRQTSTGTESLEDRIWAARPRKESGENETPEKEILKLIEKADERIKRQSQKQTLLPLKQTAPTQSTAESPQEIPAIIDSTTPVYVEEAHVSEQSHGQIENALNVLKEMAQVNADEPRIHDDLAGMYVQRGFLDDALAELHVLTIIYLRHKQFREAGATIRRISKIYARVGDVEEALTNLRHAADLMPGDVELLREIVDYCLQLGMRKDATQYLMVIARHYFDHRQFNEAVAVLQLLITYDAKNYEAYDLLGQIYQLEGKFEQASGVYRRLARLHNESSIAWERQATLQELRTMKTE
ncbi:MAG TPA: tetratricopeptide repeat protein [Ktedonobacteraceae bacterium]